MRKTSRRTGLALVLGLCLSLATVGTSAASPGAVPAQNSSLSPTSAAACPTQGQRFKTPTTGDKVYLVGPDRVYHIPNSTVYSNLWASWDGIVTGDRTCFGTERPLRDGQLIQPSGSAAIYIWDQWEYVDDEYGAWRRIANWSTFTTKYKFDPAAIRSATPLVIGRVWT
ncbi:hypothetical protein JIX56_41435 [Streptomyces sp. CA-210063]|uniref:hypothetical protein n=1 Tax=Streptomyces sp. CA-210063 TaxID=2801029 RepID=UPI00214C6913|nr:hypothetical protein [Streptomyces sp. CA-210063]UUU35796.1 hypothetical protein JIX56_41435 [Streptomyces sp. CA-210063]